MAQYNWKKKVKQRKAEEQRRIREAEKKEKEKQKQLAKEKGVPKPNRAPSHEPDSYLTPAELDRICHQIMKKGPKKPDPDLIKAIYSDVQSTLKDTMAQCCCAVCDRLMPKMATKMIPIDEFDPIISAMQTRLRHDGTLHVDLLNQYTVNHIHLMDLLLSPRGANLAAGTLSVCKECHKALRKQKKTPPKWAIANGFYMGNLPDDLWTAASKRGHCEFRMTSLSTMSAYRVVIHEAHGHLVGHALLYDNHITTAATKLPRLFNKEGEAEFFVVFASSLQDRDRLLKLQRHLADYDIIKNLLNCYRSWNPRYELVEFPAEHARVYKQGLPSDLALVADYDVGSKKTEEAQGPSTTHQQVQAGPVAQPEPPLPKNNGQNQANPPERQAVEIDAMDVRNSVL